MRSYPPSMRIAVCRTIISMGAPLAVGLLGHFPSLADTLSGSVLTYHGGIDRRGHFIVPGLTWERARTLRLDGAFHAQFSGHVYAQPLFWRAVEPDASLLVVATEDNVVRALDAKSGREAWSRSLGAPVPLSALPCGNIDPLGVTGTPVIDAGTQAIYLDAAVGGDKGPRHLVHALSLKDGSEIQGWPIDITEALAKANRSFEPLYQNQRGALSILKGTLYVPFGGHYGDCGDYRGFVVGVSLADSQRVAFWATRGRGGGIWAPGGLSSDGQSLFAATGNTIGVTEWSDGEAVLRMAPDLRRSDDKRDFFAPADWKSLDARDADLGGTCPIPLDVPGTEGRMALVLALGKDGKAYLLDKDNLGGIGGALVVQQVSRRAVIGAPAAYRAADGVYVAFRAQSPQLMSWTDDGLTALLIRAGTPPTITAAWNTPLRGVGSPIVTTTDGLSNPIVWILGAEGDNQLHGLRGDTGEPLFVGPATGMAGLHRMQTLIATEDRLFVAADGGAYSFSFSP